MKKGILLTSFILFIALCRNTRTQMCSNTTIDTCSPLFCGSQAYYVEDSNLHPVITDRLQKDNPKSCIYVKVSCTKMNLGNKTLFPLSMSAVPNYDLSHIMIVL